MVVPISGTVFRSVLTADSTGELRFAYNVSSRIGPADWNAFVPFRVVYMIAGASFCFHPKSREFPSRSDVFQGCFGLVTAVCLAWYVVLVCRELWTNIRPIFIGIGWPEAEEGSSRTAEGCAARRALIFRLVICVVDALLVEDRIMMSWFSALLGER